MNRSSTASNHAYERAMGRGGLRLTPQRRHVYEELMEKLDHPTATEVFLRVQKKISSISLATVYNCLETMVGSGLVRVVHVDREPTRFCANLREHGHFHCTECGLISDIEFARSQGINEWKIPVGFHVTQHDVTLHGICAECGNSSSPSTTSRHSATP